METKNYYQILQVSQDASYEEIRSSWRNLVAAHHPDHGGDENKVKEINEAWSTLKNIASRDRYDSQLSEECNQQETETEEEDVEWDCEEESGGCDPDFFVNWSYSAPSDRCRVPWAAPRTATTTRINWGRLNETSGLRTAFAVILGLILLYLGTHWFLVLIISGLIYASWWSVIIPSILAGAFAFYMHHENSKYDNSANESIRNSVKGEMKKSFSDEFNSVWKSQIDSFLTELEISSDSAPPINKEQVSNVCQSVKLSVYPPTSQYVTKMVAKMRYKRAPLFMCIFEDQLKTNGQEQSRAALVFKKRDKKIKLISVFAMASLKKESLKTGEKAAFFFRNLYTEKECLQLIKGMVFVRDGCKFKQWKVGNTSGKYEEVTTTLYKKENFQKTYVDTNYLCIYPKPIGKWGPLFVSRCFRQRRRQ